MKKRTKLIALLMALVLVMGSMTACGTGSESGATATPAGGEATEAPASTEPVDVALKVWAPQEDQTDYSKVDKKYGKKLLEYMCETFNEAHPEWNITFTYGVCPEGDATTELTKDPAAGADVFMYENSQLNRLLEAGILYPLTVAGMDEVKSNNGQLAIASVTNDDKVYGVPYTPNAWFMYYDKSLYSEEEVKSLDTMMAKDLGNGVANFCFPMQNSWYIPGFFFAAGSTLYGPDGTDPTSCTFNDANGVAAANYMIDLVGKGDKFLLDTDDKNGIARFKKGTLGAMCSGTWDAKAVAEALGENYAATVAPTINVNGSDSSLVPMGGYKAVGVNTNTEYPEVAQALAVWLGGEECQKDRFLAREMAPTWKSLLEDETIQAEPAVAAINAQMDIAILQPSLAEMDDTRFWDPTKAFGTGIYSGKTTKENVQTELDKLVATITGK